MTVFVLFLPKSEEDFSTFHRNIYYVSAFLGGRGLFSDAQIQEVKDANRIEDVIREYIKLKPSGSGFTGLCPFHPDKNPSLSVSVSKQIFKCFSCNTGGDVIHFISKYQNISYYEAVRFLADRAGLKIAEDNAYVSKKDEIRKKITLANREAAKFFYSQLVKEEAPKKYFRGRGITAECIQKFGLGFAPNEWSALTDHLVEEGYSAEFLEQAGLSVKSSSGNAIDKFRNRVMIPIFDVNGNVIAFGGRVMDDSKPKYMNSSETDLYTKGNHLYGLNFAKRSANKQRAIMVEGYMDCIALQNRGIDYAVASLGTALTVNQAKLLKRYFDEVVLCYDSDDAGINATQRAIPILESAGLRVKVMSVPDGKDPDEYLKKHSPDEFTALAENSATAVEYRINVLERRFPSDKMDTKTRFFNGSVDVLASIEDKTTRDMYIEWFAKKYSISRDSLVFDVNRQARVLAEEKSREEEQRMRSEMNRRSRDEQKDRSDGQNSEEGPKQTEEADKDGYKYEIEHFTGGKNLAKKLFQLEATISVLLSEDVASAQKYSKKIFDETFEFTDTRKLYNRLKKAAEGGDTDYGFGLLLDGADNDLASLLVSLEKETGLTSDIGAAVDELLKKIRIVHYDAEVAKIRQELRFAGNDEKKRAEYMQKINEILKEKRTVK